MDWSQLFTNWIEFVAVLTGAICVFLITVERRWKIGPMTVTSVWNWPLGIVSSALFAWIFYDYKLYLNSGLQIFYVATGFLGWYWWLYGGANKTELPVRRANWKVIAESLVSVVAFTALATVAMNLWTDNASPFWDALVVGLSFTAQFVMGRKFIEHWWLWIAVDVVGVFLFASQGLEMTSGLYFVYGCICVRGLFTWRRMLRRQRSVQTNPVIPVALEGA